MGEFHDRPDRPDEPDENRSDRPRREDKPSGDSGDDRWDPVLYDGSRFSDFELAENARAADDSRRTTAVPESGKPDTGRDTQAQRTADPAMRVELETPEQITARRAGELQERLPEKARGRVTMAVGVTESQEGGEVTVIGTSEPRGYLRPGVTLEPGEVIAPGSGHAEADIVRWAESRDHRVIAVGAGRPICESCAEDIARVGAQPTTPLKEEM